MQLLASLRQLPGGGPRSQRYGVSSSPLPSIRDRIASGSPKTDRAAGREPLLSHLLAYLAKEAWCIWSSTDPPARPSRACWDRGCEGGRGLAYDSGCTDTSPELLSRSPLHICEYHSRDFTCEKLIDTYTTTSAGTAFLCHVTSEGCWPWLLAAETPSRLAFARATNYLQASVVPPELAEALSRVRALTHMIRLNVPEIPVQLSHLILELVFVLVGGDASECTRRHTLTLFFLLPSVSWSPQKHLSG